MEWLIPHLTAPKFSSPLLLLASFLGLGSVEPFGRNINAEKKFEKRKNWELAEGVGV
jgi:hypothetical protein